MTGMTKDDMDKLFKTSKSNKKNGTRALLKQEFDKLNWADLKLKEFENLKEFISNPKIGDFAENYFSPVLNDEFAKKMNKFISALEGNVKFKQQLFATLLKEVAEKPGWTSLIGKPANKKQIVKILDNMVGTDVFPQLSVDNKVKLQNALEICQDKSLPEIDRGELYNILSLSVVADTSNVTEVTNGTTIKRGKILNAQAQAQAAQAAQASELANQNSENDDSNKNRSSPSNS
jgi:hypothetical protein